MKRNILSLFLSVISLAAWAQGPATRTCHTMEYSAEMERQMLARDPDYYKKIAAQRRAILSNTGNGTASKQSAVVTIPVVVHIIHNGEAVGTGLNLSAAQVQSQITALNEDFRKTNADGSLTPAPFQSARADAEINFCLAIINPTGGVMAEPGINRVSRSSKGFSAPPYTSTYVDNTIKPATQWNPSNYMNMWVTNIGTSILGWAQFPENQANLSQPAAAGPANTDGVVISYTAFGRMGTAAAPFNKGRTATHEVGHWLGLRHIWGDATCGNDGVTDTPTQRQEHYGCPAFPSLSTGACANSPNGDMFMNYMDYTDDACMFMFSAGQKARMQAVIAVNTPRRTSLTTSTVCNSPTAPVAAFAASKTTVTAGCSVTFTDQSSGNPSSWSWNFGGGGTPNTSTVQNPTVTFATAGTYTVTLTSGNSVGSDSEVKTGYITVTSSQCTQTVTNFAGTNTLYSVGAPNKGYVAGHNSYLDKAKAEKFSFCGPASNLSQLTYYFGVKKGTGSITARVWNANGTGGAPGTVLFSQSLTIASLAAPGTPTVVNLSTPIAISGDYYVGFSMTYAAGDTVALLTNQVAQAATNTAWEQWSDNTWHAFSEAGAWNISLNQRVSASFDNRPVVTVTPNTTICSGNSTALTATVAGSGNQTAPSGYCASAGTTTSNFNFEEISVRSIQFAGINNTSFNQTGYANYTSTVAPGQVTPGSTYQLNLESPGLVQFPFTYSDVEYSVYIDYNYDGDFADAGENVSNGTISRERSAPSVYNITSDFPKNVTIPAATATGLTRLRVVAREAQFTGTPVPPCGTNAVGETEDYLISIGNSATFSWSPAGGLSATSGSTVTASPISTTTYTVTVTGTNGCTNTAAVTVTVNTSTTWTGTTSSNWFTATNWTNCVPTSSTDALIPSGLSTPYPVISSGTAAARTLTQNGALTLSGGTLSLWGNFTGTGSLANTNGKVIIAGTGAQSLKGGTYYQLQINGSGNKQLTSRATVTNQLALTNGILLTGADSVILATGATMTETASSYLTGKVHATRTVGTATESFGGIGLILTPSVAPGITKVTRVTGTAKTGAGGSQSTLRYFDIHAQVNTGLNATMTMNYRDSELNSIPEGNLAMFRSTNNGATWQKEGYTSRNPTTNSVTLTGVNGFSIWTLGNEMSPLPVDLSSFTAMRVGDDARLDWVSITETNNAGYELKVSENGKEYRSLAWVPSAAITTNATNRYTYTDASKGKTGFRYYQLSQRDLDGVVTILGVRALKFEESAWQVEVYPNPFGETLSVSFPADQAGPAEVTLTDVLGRVIQSRKVIMQQGDNTLQFTTTALLPGMYQLSIQTETQTFRTNLVRQK